MSTAERRATDSYGLDDLLTEKEERIRDRVRDCCDREVLPVVNGCCEWAEVPPAAEPPGVAST